ncbi:MAG TPA: hypothetical protein VF273_06380 [Pelobium sp.]
MRLLVLLAFFFLLCSGYFILYGNLSIAGPGRLALAIMFVFSGILHIKYREGIYLSYPKFLTQLNRIKLVFIIGDLQFAFAAALVFADTAKMMVPALLLYLVSGLFTQINACLGNVSIKRGNYTGKGAIYLLFKIPEQLIIICWTYYFTLVCR